MQAEDLEYVGFWPRVGASLIDTLLAVVVLGPLFWFAFGNTDAWPTNFVYAAVVIAFWLYKQATPGKMVISARVVDAQTGGKISGGQAVGRYLAYIVSTVPLCLGFIWVAFDSKKQGWHDKLAGTVVVRLKTPQPLDNPEPVAFSQQV